MDLMDGEWMRRHFDPRSWEWIDQNHFVCRERDLAEDGDRLISREVVVHAERGVIADQFYAERLYSKERLETLLTSAGFTNVRFHPLLAPDSQRNQDLGMVAHRLFLTCEAPRRMRRLPRRAALFSDVTVVLGDPRLPDPVKRDGHWNEEDVETIERLKAALQELPDYRFRFLDNHASLYPELRTNRPHFVLNFATRALTTTRSWKCTCRQSWRCLTFLTAVPGPPALVSATTSRWSAVSLRRSTSRCRRRRISIQTTWQPPSRRSSRR